MFTRLSTFQSLKSCLHDFNFKSDDLNIVNDSPVYRISPVKYVWEVRRDMGLDYDNNDPRQQRFYSELKNTFNASEPGNDDTEIDKN